MGGCSLRRHDVCGCDFELLAVYFFISFIVDMSKELKLRYPWKRLKMYLPYSVNMRCIVPYIIECGAG